MRRPDMETLYRLWRRFDALVFFNRVIDLCFKAMIVLVVLMLGLGLARLFLEVCQIMPGRDPKEAFGYTVTSLLTFFIILELFKSLIEYFREHRLKLTLIVDGTLVFVLREIMIGLYQHQSTPWLLAALAFLALVLGGLRTLAIIYSPMERRLVGRSRESGAGVVGRRLVGLHRARKFPPARRAGEEGSHATSQ